MREMNLKLKRYVGINQNGVVYTDDHPYQLNENGELLMLDRYRYIPIHDRDALIYYQPTPVAVCSDVKSMVMLRGAFLKLWANIMLEEKKRECDKATEDYNKIVAAANAKDEETVKLMQKASKANVHRKRLYQELHDLENTVLYGGKE